VKSLETLQFDNRFVRLLAADTQATNTRRQVHGAWYSRVRPTAVRAPQLLSVSRETAALLDLDEATCRSEQFARVFSGNELLAAMEPYATVYGGHQFGAWAGQLGDGRAISLGEVMNSRGEHWTLQLKGAGPTPYSRNADGLAVLRSSVREFLCSEAMHHLGVPTTRALSLVATGEEVERDMFYDGRPRLEPGAIVCRVARSFTRFGHFEIAAARGDVALLKQLVDYTVRHDYPHLGEPSAEVYARWFDEVCQRTLQLMVHWMRVGFVHGVMNTDNLSIIGDTIDYGPYGWLESFDLSWTPNTTDAHGRRYAFGQQPQIALWNLVRLANAVHAVLPDPPKLEEALERYAQGYAPAWSAMTAARLGLDRFDASRDTELIRDLYEVMQLVETDFVVFHRNLARVDLAPYRESAESPLVVPPELLAALYDPTAAKTEYLARLAGWLRAYAARVESTGIDAVSRREQMDRLNPKYVLRNYLAQQAIDATEQGDPGAIDSLLDVLRKPYADQPAAEQYAAKRPDWARDRPGCSMLSCSS
jgi:serine/tyrosine/threonine adenylyltransferase